MPLIDIYNYLSREPGAYLSELAYAKKETKDMLSCAGIEPEFFTVCNGDQSNELFAG